MSVNISSTLGFVQMFVQTVLEPPYVMSTFCFPSKTYCDDNRIQLNCILFLTQCLTLQNIV
jgi:hypothetical protein